MPRKARLTVPGCLHHIMSRGIEGREIFRDDEDRHLFLDLMGSGIRQTGFLCYAWVLMDNHYHLALRTNERPLSDLMRRLNGAYARRFRKRHGNRGYVFQDRFKSIATQDQGYIEQIVRYVHLNPLRAGICSSIDDLDTYEWSGHAVLMGRRSCPFQTTADVLKRFGADTAAARTAYRAFVAEGLAGDERDGSLVEQVRNNNVDAQDRHVSECWVMGNREFVQKALAHDRERRIRLAQHQRQGVQMPQIGQQVAELYGLKVSDLGKRGRMGERSEARKVLAALAHRRYEMPLTRVAEYLRIGIASASVMLGEGERLLDAKFPKLSDRP